MTQIHIYILATDLEKLMEMEHTGGGNSSQLAG
jgi:hypothetical protein